MSILQVRRAWWRRWWEGAWRLHVSTCCVSPVYVYDDRVLEENILARIVHLEQFEVEVALHGIVLRLLALLLGLHASVLEPDFDLSLRESERVGDLDATTSCQVPVEMELLLQLERLVSGVRLPSSFWSLARIC